MSVRAVERWVAAGKSRPRPGRRSAAACRARASGRALLAGLLLLAGLAHADQQGGAGGGTPVGPADATPFEAASQPTTPGQTEPLPRFTVGWYCPAPQANPLSDLLGFGLGVLLIWGMAARRKARDARSA